MMKKVELFQNLPEHVSLTLEKLQSSGFEAYLAGGCVRDGLLGRKPKDFDIATNATPDDVEKLFTKTVSVGRDFGVMVVVGSDTQTGTSQSIEVATFRNDGQYVDGRRPETVTFSSAQEDAERRDFTVNGLFYDVQNREVLDFVGGLEDLDHKRIRSIGSALQRFTEDKLRILRGVRFSAELDFALEDETRKAIQKMAPELRAVSSERITEELNKIFAGRAPGEATEMIVQLGLKNSIFGGLQVFAHDELRAQLVFALGLLERDQNLGWLTLMYYEALATKAQKSELDVASALSHFRLPKDLVRNIEYALENWAVFHEFNTDALLIANDRRGLYLVQLSHLIEIVNTKLAGKSENSQLRQFMNRFTQLMDKQGELEKPWLTGSDLKAAGFAAGPIYKDLLNESFKLQLDRKLKSRDDALDWLKKQRR